MKDYKVKVTVRNNYLLTVMDEKGYTVSLLSEVAGVSPNAVYKYINLLKTPYSGVNGKPTSTIIKIAEALGTPIESLFPMEHLKNPLTKNTSTKEFSKDELTNFIENKEPTELLEEQEFNDNFDKTLDEMLTKREKEILEYRFGLNGKEQLTFDKTAKIFDVTRERIRQIQEKALRKLRHPISQNLFLGKIENRDDDYETDFTLYEELKR